jgi:adrenodoxin-NADP+ reductase
MSRICRTASSRFWRQHTLVAPSSLSSAVDGFGEHSIWSSYAGVRFLSASSHPVKVAIVGSGPSGCYTAKYLQAAFRKNKLKGKIDVLERLPTPFGLVRSGVAPDHPEVKNVQNDFSALFRDGSVSFLGNVTVGTDVSLQELRAMYDVVVLAYGCESDRKLGIQGEDTLRGVLSAREFVAWYNGHPDYIHIGEIVADALGDRPDEAEVVVIGQGNVALDCARILAKGSAGLLDTDISSHALSVLKDGVKHTTVLGRRGHIQGAFTIKVRTMSAEVRCKML